MKNVCYVWSMLILLFFCYSCEQGERVVERPAFTVRNSNTLEIDKIVLNDTATIFYIDAFYRPKYWIRIDSGTYLKAGDQKIPIVGSKDIKLQDYHWMPETGKSSFQLIFPPLSRSVKQVDLIETDCEDCFKIYGIQLKPGANPPEVTSMLPKNVKNRAELAKSELPEPDLKVGKTKLNVHMLGYQKNMGKREVSFFLNDFVGGEQREMAASLDDKGECQIEFEQYGTNVGILHSPYGGGGLIMAPGEEIDVYLDLSTISRRESPYQKVEENTPSLYTTGKYAAINTLKTANSFGYYVQTHSMDFFRTIQGMNADQYVQYIMNEVHRLEDSIRLNPGMPQVIKELNLLQNKAEAMSAICNYRNAFVMAEQIALSVTGKKEDGFKFPEFTVQHYQVLKELDLNQPKMLYIQEYALSYSGLYQIPDWKKVLGVESGILEDLSKIQGITERIENLESFTPEQEARLKSIANPFYWEAFQNRLKVLQEQQEINRTKGGYTICEVPDVATDKLFEAILAAYKGKVIFVDFWATWCGPCRAAIRQLEPAKADELKNDQIVFVYLTGDSSPKGTWLNMIPDIKGNHYRLSEVQWNAVCDKFGIQGIPSYVLVDKNGKYALREDLRDHNKLKATLLQEAGK